MGRPAPDPAPAGVGESAGGGPAPRGGAASTIVRVTAHPWTSWQGWSATWAALAAEADAGFFVAASWVGSWMDTFGAGLQPRILVFESDGGVVVGMCLIVARNESRGPIPLRRLYLNTAGEDEADETCAEYNRVLTLPGHERAVASALGEWLAAEPWDEFVADALAAPLALPALGQCHVRSSEARSHYVDLSAFPATLDGFLGSISRNSREQIRRSIRQYEQGGAVRVHAAATAAEAHAQLDDLATLHQASWRARGKPGVFASQRFFAFHHALIERALPQGEIGLLRVAAGAETIGILYGFVRAKKFTFYQSGLQLSTNNKLKPGLVAHACAIAHCAAAGLTEYDFLAGDSQYKKSLSSQAHAMTWQVFQRRGLKLAGIDLLRSLRRRWRERRRWPVR